MPTRREQAAEDWKPHRKIVAAAVAAILAWLLQVVAGVQMPPGIEAAVAVLVAYLVPSTAAKPLP
jgi:uncharacterized membrane-anchored protein